MSVQKSLPAWAEKMNAEKNKLIARLSNIAHAATVQIEELESRIALLEDELDIVYMYADGLADSALKGINPHNTASAYTAWKHAGEVVPEELE